jgi:hypothetical protein
MLLGAWAVLRAAETGKLRWLLLCAIFVGLGFNIKMLESYLSGTSSLSPSVKRGILREKLISAFTQNCDQTALNIICL